MIVIGGGIGGLTVAESCADLGARVALIERNLLGGNRLHNGAFIRK